MIEPTRQVPENPLGLLGGRTIPCLTKDLLDPGVQRRVEPLDDIASLVHLAALDQREAPEGARDAKHVPGRKTDVSDAQWLQRLHSSGLLRASFRPKGQIAELRAYLRQRERLLEYGASHIQHMQKALTEMNVQLHHVVTDITGRLLIASAARRASMHTTANPSAPSARASHGDIDPLSS